MPPTVWYDLRNHNTYQSTGQNVRLNSPLNTGPNLLLRSGHILVSQTPKTTTEETRNGDFILSVGLDGQDKAEGELYWDSGDGLDTLSHKEYDLFGFVSQNVFLFFNYSIYQLIEYFFLN